MVLNGSEKDKLIKRQMEVEGMRRKDGKWNRLK